MNAFDELSRQLWRYGDKRGLPDAVLAAWRARDSAPTVWLSLKDADLALVGALDDFLRHDGGDYGLRRAFDAYRAS